MDWRTDFKNLPKTCAMEVRMDEMSPPFLVLKDGSNITKLSVFYGPMFCYKLVPAAEETLDRLISLCRLNETEYLEVINKEFYRESSPDKGNLDCVVNAVYGLSQDKTERGDLIFDLLKNRWINAYEAERALRENCPLANMQKMKELLQNHYHDEKERARCVNLHLSMRKYEINVANVALFTDSDH